MLSKEEREFDDERWWQAVIPARAVYDRREDPCPLHSHMRGFVAINHARDWPELQSWLSLNGDNWIYRGQQDSRWELATGMDRASQIEISPNSSVARDRFRIERDILRSFKRRAGQYGPVPPDEDFIDWLALMQHYGVPTNMLDWTESPYVALYFALENRPARMPNGEGPAVWAIERDWLTTTSQSALELDAPMRPFVEKYYRHAVTKLNPVDPAARRQLFVLEVAPLKTHERIAVQQGLFLANCGNDTFQRNLDRTLMLAPFPEKPVIRKLVIEPFARLELLTHLKRMNVSGAALFPGLDGFSRSLRHEIDASLASSSSGIFE